MAPALSPDESANIDRVVGLMRAAKCLLFITGAGMSADSGLPTYRGIGGLYDGRDPEENVPIEVLLSGDVFARRPELTWKYLLQVGRAGRNAKPNRGHEILAEIEKRFERVWVLTQNVDGFHHLAGSQNVIDIHGDVRRVRCVSCAFEGPAEDYPDDPLPPRCGACGGVLRPQVVLFGEQLPARQLAVYQAETKRGFDLVFSVGTTSVFPYIAGPVLDAHHLRRPCVEINPGDTDVSEFVTVKVRLRAAEALEAIWAKYNAPA
jgi:NAD-dependent deacetylase